MNEQKEKYQCPCGSLVLKANQKQHEKTKKHLNSCNNGVVKNNAVPAPRRVAKKRHESEYSESEDQEEELDSNGEPYEDDDIGEWESDVSALLEAMNSKLGELLAALHIDMSKCIERCDKMEVVLSESLRNGFNELKEVIAKRDSLVPDDSNGVKPKAKYINEKCQ